MQIYERMENCEQCPMKAGKETNEAEMMRWMNEYGIDVI
jgi:hypothetical protein